jgi:hypothetical protein
VIDVAELAAQFPNTLRDGVVGHHNIGPHSLIKLSPSDQPSGVLGKVIQYLKRLRPQFDVIVACPQASTRQIEDESVEPQNSVRDSLIHSAPSG